MAVSRTPSKVAAFDIEKRRLRSVFSSQTYAAKMLNVKTSAVHYACSGATVACNGWYLRTLDNVDINPDDFGRLTIEKFDKLNGVERLVYTNGTIRKKRSKPTKQTV